MKKFFYIYLLFEAKINILCNVEQQSFWSRNIVIIISIINTTQNNNVVLYKLIMILIFRIIFFFYFMSWYAYVWKLISSSWYVFFVVVVGFFCQICVYVYACLQSNFQLISDKTKITSKSIFFFFLSIEELLLPINLSILWIPI